MAAGGVHNRGTALSDYRSNPEYQRQRRALIRKHHPDAGGTDAELIEALRVLDESWDRRARLRRQVREHRPSFISEQRAEQAMDAAEQAVGMAENLARSAGRFAGNIRNTVMNKLPEEFRRGYREGDK